MLARWQAREHGMPDHALRDLLRRGRWSVRTPGVYVTFTGLLGRWAELWAALLHCSHRPRRRPGVTHLPDAVLSHETAAELYGLGPQSHPIHVTIPSGHAAETGTVRRRVGAPLRAGVMLGRGPGSV